MKDKWREKLLGDCCIIKGRIGFRGYTVEDIVGEDEGAISLSPSNIKNSKLSYDNSTYISWFKYDESPEIKLEENDILLVKTGSTYGKTAQVKNLTKPATINPQIVVLKKITEDSVFLGYLMQNSIIQRQIEATVVGGAIPTLSQENISNFKIEIPPLPQQRRIARILSTCDAVLEKTEAAIAKYQAIKQGMMHDLFTRGIDIKTGKLRPKQEDAPELYKESALGWIPREWEIYELDKLSTKIVDGTHFTPKYTESGMPFLRVTDVQSEIIDFEKIKYISVEEHNELIKRCNPQKGDILYSKNGTIGIPKLITWDWEFSIFVSLALIKPIRKLIKPEYLTLILSEEIVWKQIKKRAKQGTVTNLHLEEIREFLIPVPLKDEQQILFSRANALLNKIKVEQSTLTKYREIKAGLMQDLLSGKVEVKVDEN